MISSRLFILSLVAASSAAAADLTGFPFQNESLHYNVKWPSGISMGEATVNAGKGGDGGWRFDMSYNVGVPGFVFADTYRSGTDARLCSAELERTLAHGAKKVTEKTTFDQKNGTAERKTVYPAGGGVSELRIPACAQDALAYFFFARQEMGQGRVPPAAQVFLGGAYRVSAQYTGAMDITVAGKAETTDHVNVSIKGPASDITVEVFYARDAARTPLLINVPVTLGKISLELVRR